MIEKFNKNVNVENFTNFLGIAIRLIVIDPYACISFESIEILTMGLHHSFIIHTL